MILARCETGWHGICTLELNRETNCAEHDLAGTNRGEDRHTRIHSFTHPHIHSHTHTYIRVQLSILGRWKRLEDSSVDNYCDRFEAKLQLHRAQLFQHSSIAQHDNKRVSELRCFNLLDICSIGSLSLSGMVDSRQQVGGEERVLVIGTERVP